MQLVWTTDIHLNFVDPPDLERFVARLRQADGQAVVLTGDIAEATDVLQFLQQLDDALAVPLYFVLGNHDFYRGSIHRTRDAVERFCQGARHARYLSRTTTPVTLGDGVGLVGHDGWADGRSGDFLGSWVMMNDYRLIEELAGRDKKQRWEQLQWLGDEAALHVRKVLPLALAKHQRVVLATHVPPFRQACWHEGRLSDDEWAPHFVCVALGQAILDIMRDHPYHHLLVLCGHTHGSGETRPLHNVVVRTGGARYGHPDITGCPRIAAGESL